MSASASQDCVYTAPATAPHLSRVLPGEESKRPPICRTGLRPSFWRQVLQHAVHPGRAACREILTPG